MVHGSRLEVQDCNGTPPHADPAERSGYLRYFYRGWRPTLLARIWNRAYAWVSGLGILPSILATVQIEDRRDHGLRSTILVVAKHGGNRCLVSMLGNNSDWVQNARASGGRAFIKRWRTYPVTLTEIPTAERAAIIKAWCQVVSSGRKHLPLPASAPLAEFEKIAEHYPVFRIDAA